MSLYSFLEWCQFRSVIGTTINDSRWMFAIIESIHLVGLALLGGGVIVMNMRLLGLGLTTQPPVVLHGSLRPWLVGSLITMIVTGILLFFAVATKLYDSFAFRVKMSSLALAILFTFTVHSRVARADEGQVTPRWSKTVAVISLVLWAGVAWGGRWIAFE